MVLIFKCEGCNSLKFFSNFELINERKFCLGCFADIEKKKIKLREKEKQDYLKRKKIRKIKSQKLADKKLLEELKRDKEKKTKKKVKLVVKEVKTEVKKGLTKKKFSLELEALRLSKIHSTVLYVYATVKRFKVIEWRDGKKKVLLNKEREIRRTHKGGWSQEKFQRFVDTQKKKTFDWIESLINRSGVLRPPYGEVIIETDSEKLKEFVNKKLGFLKV